MFGAAENGLRRLLGPLELRIMEAVWAAGQPVAIRDICDQLAHEANPPAFTTVMTIMNRLVEKDFLLRSG
ncbi:MAG: BlaI/MecI/CopY family transcriptional regulator, partial [Mycobacterium leprae]